MSRGAQLVVVVSALACAACTSESKSDVERIHESLTPAGVASSTVTLANRSDQIEAT